tara:strand:- start:461 stop:817 length:357 start_codon:yes stop_codon:yes gene_type:complete
MANKYKNAFYTPSGTNTQDLIYTCPDQTRSIFQTIQLTNISGSKNVTVRITDFSASTSYVIAYVEITGPTIVNVLKGSIVLEELDTLTIETTATSGISGTAALLETTRVYIAETGGPS